MIITIHTLLGHRKHSIYYKVVNLDADFNVESRL
jgi:hypothetical protein